MPVRRTIVVRKDDILVVNGMELDGAILKEIVSPSKRLLWAFVKNGDDCRPICFSEDQCIWLTPAVVDLGVEV
jgi:ABC-type Zn uptake system ZnuABC Zn-binding protein ZnuA